MQLRRFGLVFATTLIYGAAIATAQESGQIVGVVRDPTGAVIPGVTVRAEESQTGFDRTAVTNASGQYELRSLRPTTYVISAESAGFKKINESGVQLLANQ